MAEVRTLALGLITACVLLAMTALAIAPILISGLRVAGVLGFGFGLAVFLVPAARLTARALCASRPWWGCQTVVLGDGDEGRALVEMLKQRPELGLSPAVLLDDHLEAGTEVAGVPVAGPIALASRYALEHRVPYAIVAMPCAGRERIVDVVDQHGRHFDRVLVVPDLAGLTSLWVSARDLGGTLGLEIRHRLLAQWRQRFKRIVDLVTVLLMAPLLLPIGLAVAAFVRFDSKGAVLYRQERLGRDGRNFTLYKFRSMHVGAEGLLRGLLARNPDERPSGGHELTVVVRRPDGSSSLGLAIDEAYGVVTAGQRRNRSIDDLAWVAGRMSMEDRTVFILDPEKLFVPTGTD